MSSEQIHALLAPADIVDAESKCLTYIESQCALLDNVQLLVEQAEHRSRDLQVQLSKSQTNIDSLISQTRASSQTHLSTAKELSLLRHSLTDELSYLSDHFISSMDRDSQNGDPTLLEDIETLHRNLHELQSVKSYVRVVHHALKLSELAVQNVPALGTPISTSAPFIQDYKHLDLYVSKLVTACEPASNEAGDQSLQLVQFLERTRDKTWQGIKATLSASLLEAAEKLHWPSPVDYRAAAVQDRKAFETAFSNLLHLQDIGEQIHPSGVDGRNETDGLYPLQALIQPISLRFKYHFEGTRETNRLDKPEWYFARILDTSNEHKSFMEEIVQQLLSSTSHKTINAWREFTLLLLPLLSRKLRRTVPSMLSHPSLLAHTVYQTLSFDAALTELGFGIERTSAGEHNPKTDQESWKGVSEILLGNKEWFNAWIQGEKTYAEERYMEIVSATDAWLIADNEDADQRNAELKSTNSARQIKSLVEQTTDRYSPLPAFSQRTQFLISVQLPILEHYHSRVSSSLEAFEALSSAFVRAVPGALGVSLGGKEDGIVHIDTGRLTSGVDGVQRLCKALISAKYIGAAMEKWGEDLFFLELWAEINHRASLRASARANPLLPDPQASNLEAPSDTIFEELIVKYAQLAVRAQDMIVQQVCGEIEGGLKTHYASATSSSEEIALSQTLLAPIALLSSHLKQLIFALPSTLMMVLYKRIASRLAEHILQRQILYRGHVTAVQGVSILAECQLWIETCQVVLGRNTSRIGSPWLKLLYPARIISATGEPWSHLVDAALGASDKDWAEILGKVGVQDMTKEEVIQIIRTREDFRA